MAFSSGVFSRLYNWVTDRDGGIKIRADRMDGEFDGIATGLSTCILKDGTQTITADIPFATNKITGLGDPSAAQDGATKNYVDTTAMLKATPQLGGMLDVNGNAIGDGTLELLTFTEDASAVNHVNIENEATGSGPIISGAGDDTNVDLNLSGKGAGVVKIGGSEVATIAGTQTLSNKTIASPSFTGDMTTTGSITIDGSSADRSFTIDTDAGQNRIVEFSSGDLIRWHLLTNSAAESGSDVGSDFALNSYDDAGSYLATPVYVTRATGNTALTSLTLTTKLAVAQGGTGASTEAAARTNLAVLGSADENQVFTGGLRVTSRDGGTVTTTETIDPSDRPLQHYINGGAHTLNPDGFTGFCWLDITNNASAGAITTSGWTKVVGSFTTTNGDKFRCRCTVGDAGSLLEIQAMQ